MMPSESRTLVRDYMLCCDLNKENTSDREKLRRTDSDPGETLVYVDVVHMAIIGLIEHLRQRHLPGHVECKIPVLYTILPGERWTADTMAFAIEMLRLDKEGSVTIHVFEITETAGRLPDCPGESQFVLSSPGLLWSLKVADGSKGKGFEWKDVQKGEPLDNPKSDSGPAAFLSLLSVLNELSVVIEPPPRNANFLRRRIWTNFDHLAREQA